MDGIVDKLYSQFLLRDVFSKIVPGCLLLVGFIAAASGEAYSDALRDLVRNCCCDWFILLLLAVAWPVGFLTQEFAATLRIINVDTPVLRILASLRGADSAGRQLLERQVVIKESAGNVAAALIVLLLFKWTADPQLFPARPVVWFLVVASVGFLHRNGRAAAKQREIENRLFYETRQDPDTRRYRRTVADGLYWVTRPLRSDGVDPIP